MDELDPNPLDGLMEGAPNNDPEAYALLTEASKAAALKLIEIPHFDLLPYILESTRRVISIFFGSNYRLDPGYQEPDLILNLTRFKDIQWELDETRGIKVPLDDIGITLQTLPEIEVAFLPFADFLARKYIVQPDDFYERVVLQLTSANLSRSVWMKWQPEGKNIVEDIISLRKCVWGRLNYIWHSILVLSQRQPEEINLSQLDEELDFLERNRVMSAFQEPNEVFQKPEFLEIWRTAVEHLSLKEVLSVIGQIPVEYQLSLLIHFQFINPGKALIQTLEEFSMTNTTYNKRLRFAIWLVVDFLTHNNAVNDSLTLRDHIQYVIENGVFYLKGKVLPVESPRIKFSRYQSSPQFLAKLTDTEQQVFRYACTKEGTSYLYTINDITDILPMSKATVILALHHIHSLIKTGEDSFIYSSGMRLTKSSPQYKLLMNPPTPAQLCILSPGERRLYTLITTPDENGRYSTIADARKKLGMSRKVLPQVICNKMQSSDWILDMRDRLLEFRKQGINLTAKRNRIINYVLYCIENGVSIGSQRGNTLGVNLISKELNISRTAIHKLLTRIKHS